MRSLGAVDRSLRMIWLAMPMTINMAKPEQRQRLTPRGRSFANQPVGRERRTHRLPLPQHIPLLHGDGS